VGGPEVGGPKAVAQRSHSPRAARPRERTPLYDATMGDRDEAVETIQREMAAFARRARAAAARMHPELSLVSYTLLAHLDDRPGSRATDLAAEFLLDKSTVSRQVSGLEQLGFVERRPDPRDHRVQVLHPTPAGAAVLAAATAARREAFRGRFAGWDEADLDRFASYLVSFNEAAADQRAPEDSSAVSAAASPGQGSAPGR
jgi:DNA-binding MarR family transcriptional regulator